MQPLFRCIRHVVCHQRGASRASAVDRTTSCRDSGTLRVGDLLCDRYPTFRPPCRRRFPPALGSITRPGAADGRHDLATRLVWDGSHRR